MASSPTLNLNVNVSPPYAAASSEAPLPRGDHVTMSLRRPTPAESFPEMTVEQMVSEIRRFEDLLHDMKRQYHQRIAPGQIYLIDKGDIYHLYHDCPNRTVSSRSCKLCKTCASITQKSK